jgi:histidyl-tRNA synthetase
MKIEKSKGMRDLFPDDMEKFRLINEIFRDSCLKWGYEEVRTPTLESLHLFTSAGTLTPSMLGRVYSFLDWDGWSGERVVLRPDATIPVARLFIENLADREMAKLFYIVNTFIFEETGQKNREKWQFGAELIGQGSPLADVELIVLAMEILNRLGLDHTRLKLSHAGLTRGILQKLGLNSEEQHQIFDRLLDGDPAVLSQIKAEKPELVPLLALQGQSSGFIKNLAASLALDSPELKAQIDDFIRITDILGTLGYHYEIDIASVRGFEYYTGILYQFLVDEEKVGGGGRYDALIPTLGGRDTPASGFALYADLLIKLIDQKKLSPLTVPKILLNIDAGAHRRGFVMAEKLHDAGYIVKIHLGGKGPTDVDWQLDVREQSPRFILIDLNRKKRAELQTPAEVLKKIQS